MNSKTHVLIALPIRLRIHDVQRMSKLPKTKNFEKNCRKYKLQEIYCHLITEWKRLPIYIINMVYTMLILHQHNHLLRTSVQL